MKPGLRARHPADPFEPPSRQWYRTPDHYPLACVFVPLFPNPHPVRADTQVVVTEVTVLH